MRTFINPMTGEKISESTYNSLSPLSKANFRERTSSDSSSFGTSLAIGAATDSALLGGLLGGDLIGGMLGDLLDGDLND